MRPRLGIHCPGNGSGGPWRYVHSLLAHINLDEFDVCVFCDIDGVYEQRPGVRVVQLTTSPKREQPNAVALPMKLTETRRNDLRLIAGFLRSAIRLARVFASQSLDLLHTQNTGCEEAPFAARLAGISHVVGTFHTDSTYDLHRERDSWGYHCLERLSNRSLHQALAVSAATGRDWRHRTFIPSSRVGTIHNGINAAKFARTRSREAARLLLDLPHEAFLVIGLGRLDEAKGFADLIDAASLLRAALPELVVAIAGEGPLRASLEALARFKQVNVRFLGFQMDVQPLLEAADLFALPSLCEACPFAVLEAMAAGVPVLGSDVGGVSELLRGAGVILPPRDPSVWALAIHKLAHDSETRKLLGNLGQLRVSMQFTEDDMVSRTFRVYRRLLGAL